MSKVKLSVGLRGKVFAPDQRIRAQQALERLAFALDGVTEVERRDEGSGAVSFVVWSTCDLGGRVPAAVLGFPVTVKVSGDAPELLA